MERLFAVSAGTGAPARLVDHVYAESAAWRINVRGLKDRIAMLLSWDSPYLDVEIHPALS